jgi:hypothetical protein
MEKNWKDENVDLALLAKYIGDFLKKEDFEAIKGEMADGYQILAQDSPYFKLNGYVNVTITGNPNDFTVRLELCNVRKKHFGPILFSTMFVGGYFLKKKLKSEEDWMKFERNFWKHLDNVISYLSGMRKNFER